ncbi:MAG TPA: ABC transporter permease [Actinokineospora sp.]|nr:ABC transporter permease [Actinokineospora sp.]
MSTETLSTDTKSHANPRSGSLARTGLLIRYNVLLRLRDPGQMISYLVLPMVIMVVFKPLYVKAFDGGTLHAVIGPLVMFSMFALGIVGNSILVEREWRTWDRLRTTKAGRGELLFGKLVPPFAILIVQQTILLTFGTLVVGMPVPPSLPLLAIAVAVWGLTLLAIGAALATVARSRGDLNMVSDLGAMVISSLGGALVPVTLMPGWVAAIAPFSPGYWAMDLMRAAVDDDFAGMVRPALVCLTIAVVAGVFAGYRLARGWGRSHLI